PRHGGKVREEVVTPAFSEFFAKGPRPGGLLAAHVGAQLVAVNVQVLEHVGAGSCRVREHGQGGMGKMTLDAGAVKHVGLVTTLGVAGSAANALALQGVSET